jgi:hypothetical protein
VKTDKTKMGLFGKFHIVRTDGKSAPGQKHHGCDYFVLDLTHDPFAVPALRAYADACRQAYPLLARDLDAKVSAPQPAGSAFETLRDTAGAASVLGVSPRTLEHLRVRGGGPRFVKVGKRVRYRDADLRAYLDDRTRASTAESKGGAR